MEEYTSFNVWLAFGFGLFLGLCLGILVTGLRKITSKTQEWPNTCPACGSIDISYRRKDEKDIL